MSTFCDFFICETCNKYWPSQHPGAQNWLIDHAACSLPEYTDFDFRMEPFNSAYRRAVHLVQQNEVPNNYTCSLGFIELLAFGGLVSEPENAE